MRVIRSTSASQPRAARSRPHAPGSRRARQGRSAAPRSARCRSRSPGARTRAGSSSSRLVITTAPVSIAAATVVLFARTPLSGRTPRRTSPAGARCRRPRRRGCRGSTSPGRPRASPRRPPPRPRASRGLVVRGRHVDRVRTAGARRAGSRSRRNMSVLDLVRHPEREDRDLRQLVQSRRSTSSPGVHAAVGVAGQPADALVDLEVAAVHPPRAPDQLALELEPGQLVQEHLAVPAAEPLGQRGSARRCRAR